MNFNLDRERLRRLNDGPLRRIFGKYECCFGPDLWFWMSLPERGFRILDLEGSLQNYIDEVLEGTLGWAVRDGKIHYTYHERLFNYPPEGIDQISYIIEKLKRTGFSRRAQAITWIPKRDMGVDSPPCLQRIWCTIRDGKLILHTSWRSRDIFRAMHMNMLAMTELQKRISEEVGVEVGSYVDFSNSAHIYEKTYWDVERFINVLERRRGSEVNSA